jgi:hypothetical protein
VPACSAMLQATAPARGQGILSYRDAFGDETHGREMENCILSAICILGHSLILFHGTIPS